MASSGVETRFAAPSEVSDVELAFPANALKLMPSYDEIPDEFKGRHGTNKWMQAQRDWFFSGLRDLKTTTRNGIDARMAMRHLGAIQGSFEPKHEHKQAAVAYLMSLWFETFEYTKGDPKR